jgi:hypothetical protein
MRLDKLEALCELWMPSPVAAEAKAHIASLKGGGIAAARERDRLREAVEALLNSNDEAARAAARAALAGQP